MDGTKKEKLKELETELVSNTNKDFNTLTNNIAEFLYNYTLRTRYHYSKEFPKMFGNVSFWLEQKDGQVVLMYNAHPKDWNVNSIIFQFEMEEKKFFDHIWAGANKNYDQY